MKTIYKYIGYIMVVTPLIFVVGVTVVTNFLAYGWLNPVTVIGAIFGIIYGGCKLIEYNS